FGGSGTDFGVSGTDFGQIGDAAPRFLSRSTPPCLGLFKSLMLAVPFAGPRPERRPGDRMICTNCGFENEAGRKFCGECGHFLAVICPSCAKPNTPGMKFCGECGSPLSGISASSLSASTTAEAGGPTTERRLVSVLFADLVGFTALSESRDPEEVRELL